MMTTGMYSSKSPEWATPQKFFDALNAEFHFTLDVCATKENAKCIRYFTTEDDGLKAEWGNANSPEVCWMNPPYGRGIGAWVKKAYESATGGVSVICLLPARTDTAWWHDYCAKGAVRFIRGRLKFGDGKNNAPFPSAIVIFKG